MCILYRPRHQDLVARVRSTGARIKFISDGDVAGAIMAASPDIGVDLTMESAARRKESSPPVHSERWVGRSRRNCGSKTTTKGSEPSMPATTSTGS